MQDTVLKQTRPATGHAALTIRRIRTRSVSAPMKRPLRTSVGTVANAPLVLIDIETEEGIVGHAYLFAYVPALCAPLQAVIADMATQLSGDRIAPMANQHKASRRYQLVGTRGLVSMALAGIDIACWDALAKAVNLPLTRLLGGEITSIPAYNSNGLGIMPAEEAADEAVELLAEGFSAVKVRLGHPSVEEDLAVVRAIRKRIPDEAVLMADYNHALTVAEAIKRGHALDGEGLYWIEEPTTHDDFPGNARIANELKTATQIGENFNSVAEMSSAIAARASDYVMPDLERIGGVTGWLHAAGVAQAARIPMSTHLFAEVSAHLMAVTPTGHWLEFVDWADAILQEPLKPANSAIAATARPGVGLSWNEDAVNKYLLQS
jgi:mandelate racemase